MVVASESSIMGAPDGEVKVAATMTGELVQPEGWGERNRAWSTWAYETVTEAINLYGARGTFFEILGFFAQKRQSLALAYRSHEAHLFGVWRDEQLAPALRMRTTFFGPPPYDKAARAYQQMLGMAPSSAIKGVVKATIGRDTYELTSFRVDGSADPRGKMWLHTHWRYVQPIMNHCRELFEIALEPISDEEARVVLAQLHWWFVQALPFARGSTTIAEWVVSFVCRMRGAGGIRFNEDPAAQALVMPNYHLYTPAFLANLQLVQGRSTHQAQATPERDLAYAARTGQGRRLRRLLLTVAAGSHEPTGYTPLHLAAREGQVGAVKALLRSGAPVDVALADSGETPLHLAAREGHVRIVNLLLRHGAAIDGLDSSESTPLHWAVRGQHGWVVSLLCYRGARLDAVDTLGRLPLHYAAEGGASTLASTLIRRAPRTVQAVDRRGETPLSLAALRGHVKIVDLLLRHNAKAPPQDPQLLAIKLVNQPEKRQAIEAGVDISLYWLLSRTAERGHVKVCEVLEQRLLRRLPARDRANARALLPRPTAPAATSDFELDESFR